MARMGRVTLTIHYRDDSICVKNLSSKRDAIWYAYMEGDHVLRYWIRPCN